MAVPEERPIDESLDLDERTDDRDRGYGIVAEDDEIMQSDPAGDDLDED